MFLRSKGRFIAHCRGSKNSTECADSGQIPVEYPARICLVAGIEKKSKAEWPSTVETFLSEAVHEVFEVLDDDPQLA